MACDQREHAIMAAAREVRMRAVRSVLVAAAGEASMAAARGGSASVNKFKVKTTSQVGACQVQLI